MWNGTMFVDLDWPLNALSLLSASAELLVIHVTAIRHSTACNVGRWQPLSADKNNDKRYMKVITEIRHLRVHLSRSPKVIGTDTDRSATQPAAGFPWNRITVLGLRKLGCCCYQARRMFANIFSCLDTIHACDRQTDGHRPTTVAAHTHNVAW